jgi:hypothetical protein
MTTLEQLRNELARQRSTFEQARAVLANASDETFVRAGFVEELEAALAPVHHVRTQPPAHAVRI